MPGCTVFVIHGITTGAELLQWSYIGMKGTYNAIIVFYGLKSSRSPGIKHTYGIKTII